MPMTAWGPNAPLDGEPTCLTHYTNADGLKGILEEKVLRATDIRFLNDPSELAYSRSAVWQFVSRPPDDIGSPADALLHELQGRLEYLAVAFEIMPVNHYVVSFSDHPNDLSQWRAYGSPHVGYSISFQRDALHALELSDPPPPPYARGPVIDKVLYSPEQQLTRSHSASQQLAGGRPSYRRSSRASELPYGRGLVLQASRFRGRKGMAGCPYGAHFSQIGEVSDFSTWLSSVCRIALRALGKRQARCRTSHGWPHLHSPRLCCCRNAPLRP